MPLRVAIVGSGVSGLAALWALNQSTENEVHIFEAQDYIGGHVQTVYWQTQRGDKREKRIPVDLAFSLFNEATYRKCLFLDF
jgi:predicted NAD/FAD-binding protein